MLDEGGDLLFSVGGVERLGGALDDVGDAVELRAHAAVPERMERFFFAVERFSEECFWHDGECAADAGEAAVFREAAELDRALVGAGDFVDGMRDSRFADVGFVGGVVEEDGFVAERVLDPAGELLAGGDRAGGIVREAEVDDVHLFLRDVGDEAVGSVAREINKPLVGADFVRGASVPGHDVRVHVNGIDGVHDGDEIVVAEDVEDAAAVALRSVGDKNFVVLDVEAPVAVVVLRDGVSEKIVALLGAVASESFARAHVVHGLVECGEDGSRKRFGDVADAAADHVFRGVGILVAEKFHAPRDLGEEVSGAELEVVVVEEGHFLGKLRVEG